MGRAWGLVLLALAAMALPLQAADLHMRVDGAIGIDPEGKVFAVEIDTIVTPQVKEVVERTMRTWRFEPVLQGDRPDYVKSDMSLELLARKVEAGYQLQVEGVRFYSGRKAVVHAPPPYPRNALRSGISGDVLVAVRVDAEGKVQEAAAVQTSLPYRNTSLKQVQTWGRYFEKAAVQAAESWVFAPANPEAGDLPETTLVVPVSYRVSEPGSPPPALFEGWQAEALSVKRPIPWLPADQQEFDPTGLEVGEALALESQVKLASPVVGTML